MGVQLRRKKTEALYADSDIVFIILVSQAFKPLFKVPLKKLYSKVGGIRQIKLSEAKTYLIWIVDFRVIYNTF